MLRFAALLVAALVVAACADDGSATRPAASEPGPSAALTSPTTEPVATEPSATEPAAPSTGSASDGPGPQPSGQETATPTPSETTTPGPPPPTDAFDGDAAHRFAVDLAGLGPRESGTDGDRTGQAFIRDAFERAGWVVVAEEVALPQGGTTANVIALRDPADLERRHVVVGGHHDTRGGGPGANDNASGVGVLLELAGEIADDVSPVPVVLVAFGAEEYQPAQPRLHHLGSADYVERHGEHVVAAAVVDMVGNGDRHCICWFDRGPRTMAERYLAAARAVGLGDRVAIEARGDISDHGPFARAGLPAAFLWSYDDGRLHTPADTAEHLDADDIDRAGEIVLAFVRSLTEADDEVLRAAP